MEKRTPVEGQLLRSTVSLSPGNFDCFFYSYSYEIGFSFVFRIDDQTVSYQLLSV